MVKLTGGQRIDLLGIRKEDLPGVWADLGMPSGYAYGKSFRTVKTCVGSGVLPVRRRRLDRSWASRSSPGSRAWSRPAKIKLAVTGCPRNCAESYVQGRRRRRRRRRPLGDLHRRRGRRAHPQGRPAGHRRRPRDGQTALRPVPAVLPGERQVAGAHLRLRPAGRSRVHPGGDRRGQPGHRADLDAAVQEPADTLQRPLAGGRGPGHPGPVPDLAAAGGPAAGAGPSGPASCWEVPGDRRDAIGCRHRLGRRPDPDRRGPGLRRRRRAGRRLPAPRRRGLRACPRSARTGAGRSPTARSTTGSCCARCT